MTKTALPPTGEPPAKFEELTETSDVPLSPEAASMMYTRYLFGLEFAQDARLLEIGCGPGHGFGLLGSAASRVVGGDVSMALLQRGRGHYGERFPLVQFSAEQLPFSTNTFDVILFFEASYYVPNMSLAFDEIARLLAPGGVVLFVNANPDRPDFVPSPYSVHYHSADEFRRELGIRGFDVHVAGAFPIEASDQGLGRKVMAAGMSLARRGLQRLGLVPKTLRGRARLKKLVYRNLVRLQPELARGFASEAPRQPVASGPVAGFKVLYVSGKKPR